MPDLDDLLEDAVDLVKKQIRTRRKRRKKAAKRRAQTPNLRQPQSDASFAPADPVRSERASTQHWGDGGINAAWGPIHGIRRRLSGPYIHSDRLRAQREQAEAYAAGIRQLAHKAHTDMGRARMRDLVRQTEHWQKSLQALIERVDAYQQNSVLQRDLAAVPNAIARLESRLQDMHAPRVNHELERALDNRRRQLASLEKLASTMQWAEIKIENTVSVLGSLYSQAHVSQSKGHLADFGRLLADVEEEARSLEDYVAAMSEVKGV